MKVQYCITLPQRRAVSLLANINGLFSLFEENDNRIVIEYDVTEDQKGMLDTLLNQKGVIINDKPQWPSKGDEYYFISEMGGIKQDNWTTYIDGTPSTVDTSRHNIGNIFKTREEAEFEIERLKVLNQLKSLSDDDQKWNNVNLHSYITYNLHFEMFDILSFSSTKLPYNVPFKSTASARAAIKTIGEDRLKKYVFGVKEKEN